MAEQANKLGRFDAVIHNAGVGYRETPHKTADGLPHVFAINVLAPYVLTALIEKPKRWSISVPACTTARRRISTISPSASGPGPRRGLCESKLYDVVLAFAVARRWPDVFSNALEPGWVPTRMGGAGAPDDMDQAHRTQVWLAVSEDKAGARQRRLFLSPEAPRAEPAGQGRRPAGPVHRGVRGAVRRHAADLSSTTNAAGNGSV